MLGKILRSSEDGGLELGGRKTCRWLDVGKYFQWKGNLLVNDKGEFLSLNDGKVLICTHWKTIGSNLVTSLHLIVKLLAKSKLKSLPYNHTDHPAITSPATLNQVYTSLYKSYINIWGIVRIVHSRAIYLSTVTHPNQTESTFDWQFSDLNYIKIKLNLTAE